MYCNITAVSAQTDANAQMKLIQKKLFHESSSSERNILNLFFNLCLYVFPISPLR